MNKDRIYDRLQRINDSIYDLDCKVESFMTEHDKKEHIKKRSKLVKQRNKLKKRLHNSNER